MQAVQPVRDDAAHQKLMHQLSRLGTEDLFGSSVKLDTSQGVVKVLEPAKPSSKKFRHCAREEKEEEIQASS